jgi:pilus assembly protein CpaB
VGVSRLPAARRERVPNVSRRIILLTVAVVVAALGTGLVFLYVQGADNRAEERFDTVDVLRAVAPIEPGETIDSAAAAGKLQIEAVAQSDLLPNAQSDTAALKGLVATTRIYPGEQIISDKFSSEIEEALSSLTIPKDMVAISVNLTDPARVAGFVNPGSQVSIFVNTDVYTRLLLPRVTVLGVGSTTPTTTTTTTEEGGETTEQLPRTLLTVAVTQKDAERVMYASTHGELAFALLTENSKVASSGGTSDRDLF